ncbi:hypothetical protein HDV06_001385 [Boothiomyces sp. JEL0866]|nr:hypothetical protein HDV06_001385 [Boothiomyces sp. JEL0866]
MPNWNLDISTIDKSAKCKINPPAFSLKHKSESREHKEVEQMAISPSKSIPMNAFMLYMSGGSTFETIMRLKNSKITLPIIVFAILNLANFGLGVWKCGSMGLLPTTSSDWLAFLPAKTVLEHVVG